MSRFFQKMSRRSFVALPVLAPLAGLDRERSDQYWFHYDHVIGTSLDFVAWGPSSVARRAARAVLDEVDRLAAILSTYDPSSEISQFDRSGGPVRSRELGEVLAAYKYWERETGGILSVRPRGTETPLNVDALGKAYIIDRAVTAARASAPELAGLLLNIGGDIVVWGRACEVNVADPSASHDNGIPLTRIVLENAAVATSGTYARGSHLIDARTGRLPQTAASATVVARDAVTANALATTLCIVGAAEGLQLLKRVPGAEALRIEHPGAMQRTAGFAGLERIQTVRQTTAISWPANHEVTIALTLITPNPRLDRSYVAVWAEDSSGKLVRAIVLWGSKKDYYPDMSGFWAITGGDQALIYKVTRATRAPGSYKIVWNGLDDQGKPVPRGAYRIVVETNRYRGTYAKQTGMISCDSEPVSLTLNGSVNFETIVIQYGPKPGTA